VSSTVAQARAHLLVDVVQRDSLSIMQRECKRLINSSFCKHSPAPIVNLLNDLRIVDQLVDKTTRLNYANFNTSIKAKLGIDVKDWPEGVPFKSPYAIGNMEQISTLRDALKTRTCHFVKMPPREYRLFLDGLEARRSSGEAVTRPRKKRSDSGVPRKRKNVQDKGNAAPAKKGRTRARKAPTSLPTVMDEDEDDEDDERDNHKHFVYIVCTV
jgi:hypothetical protein